MILKIKKKKEIVIKKEALDQAQRNMFKFIKTNYIPGGGVGYKVMLKPCPRGQTFTAMIGYCTNGIERSFFGGKYCFNN